MASKILRKFWDDRRGNYVILTGITMIPLCGAMALGVDYAEMTRERQVTLNALDAAGIATARRLVAGVTDQQAKDYATDFFNANLASLKASTATLTVTLPNSNTGGGTLKLAAQLKYKPYFMNSFRTLLGQSTGDGTIAFDAKSEIRLKNTLEVAMVLDNSGSMDETAKGSSKSRLQLLKDAAHQLVTTLTNDAQQMKQVAQPVRISLVPFAGSVNVDPGNADASWMDTTGISPIHHENFDWATMTTALNPNKYALWSGGVWYAKGSDWGTAQKDKPLTRFSLYNLMQRVSSKSTSNNKTTYTYASLASWGGCVEARPYPYNVNDTAPTTSTPATLFVPMFAPDEGYSGSGTKPYNNWLDDGISPSGSTEAAYKIRQRYMPKYFTVGTSISSALGMDEGPNSSCSTAAITPLTDTTTTAGRTTVDNAIDAMVASGATNVPEGMAWGWRTVSSTAPFTQARSESERGNDKVVIVLTDGANTYYTPESLGASDYADNESIYSALGFAELYDNTAGRIFGGTSNSVSKSDFSNANYTKAMNEHFATLCANAKAGNLIVMTVAVDLSSSDTAEKAQIEALKACASESKYTKDATDPSKPAKLFWNSTGGTLSEDFKNIARELSNLRIVS